MLRHEQTRNTEHLWHKSNAARLPSRTGSCERRSSPPPPTVLARKPRHQPRRTEDVLIGLAPPARAAPTQPPRACRPHPSSIQGRESNRTISARFPVGQPPTMSSTMMQFSSRFMLRSEMARASGSGMLGSRGIPGSVFQRDADNSVIAPPPPRRPHSLELLGGLVPEKTEGRPGPGLPPLRVADIVGGIRRAPGRRRGRIADEAGRTVHVHLHRMLLPREGTR